MLILNALKMQQSPPGAMVPECWRLPPDRALTLRPDVAGVLQVSQGRVWVTTDGPHQGPANDWGDRVLQRGEQLQLQPGQQVVLEAYGDAVNAPAFFCWEPAETHPATAAAPTLSGGWRLARAVARLGELLSWLVPGRGRVLCGWEANQP